MPAVERDASARPLGITLRLLLHLQVHQLAWQSRWPQYAHGVRVSARHERFGLMWWNVRSFEDALLTREPNPIISAILSRFILNLKPGTRNTGYATRRLAWRTQLNGGCTRRSDNISITVQTVLAEYFKSSERTVFWNDELKANVDPFQGMETGFFAADWDFKVRRAFFLGRGMSLTMVFGLLAQHSASARRASALPLCRHQVHS